MSLDEELDELTTKIIQGKLKKISDNLIKYREWDKYLKTRPDLTDRLYNSYPLPPRNLEQTIAPPVSRFKLKQIADEFWERYDYKPMSISPPHHWSKSIEISMEQWHKDRVAKAIEEDPVKSPKILALLRAGYAIDTVEVYKVFVESEGGTLLTGKMKVKLHE